MIFIHPPIVSLKFFIFLSAVGLLLPACANTPWADRLGRSLAPDPRLKDSPVAIGLPAATPSPSALPSPSADLSPNLPGQETPDLPANLIPKPGDPKFIGPIPSAKLPSKDSTSTSGNASTAPKPTDLRQVSTEFQSYITDLTNLGALQLTSSNGFEPNKAITRREYARWLVTANNLIYANVPARKIRLGASTDSPAFKDVVSKDSDFRSYPRISKRWI